MDFHETIAVVSGGASGLGEATVRNIVAGGGKAAILDISVEKGQGLAQELGENAIFIKTDVTDEQGVKEAIETTCNRFGTINVAVNCAGIAIGEKTVGRGQAHRLESFKKVIEINLIGMFNLIRLAAEKMAQNEGNQNGERGVIINTASVAAFDGQIGQAAYSASKGGIVGMTLPIARDLSQLGIRVVTIAPGLFDTPMFNAFTEDQKKALGAQVPFPPRLGNTAEYAKMTQSIIENPMLNGETIRLDGAIRMAPK